MTLVKLDSLKAQIQLNKSVSSLATSQAVDMFPNDSPAQGSGQQYSLNFNNGYYVSAPKRPCLPNYTAQQQYSFSPFPVTSQPAQFYPQNFGYSPIVEEESRRRKTVQVIDDHKRPIWTFTGLAVLSLLNAPDNTATTDEIYSFVLTNFPLYIEQNHASWTGAIRHNLTKKKNLFLRNSESKRNGKWSLISVEEAKKEVQREIGKSKRNARCGMERQEQFEALVGRFLPSQATPTALSASTILSSILSSPPIYYEECPVIQSEPPTSPITFNGISFQSEPDIALEYSSTLSSNYVFNAPVYSEEFSSTQFDPITFNSFFGHSFENLPVTIVEESPTVSVEHLEFDIIDEEF